MIPSIEADFLSKLRRAHTDLAVDEGR